MGFVFFSFFFPSKIWWSNKIIESLHTTVDLLMSLGHCSYSNTSAVNVLTFFGKRVYSSVPFSLAVLFFYRAAHNALCQYLYLFYKDRGDSVVEWTCLLLERWRFLTGFQRKRFSHRKCETSVRSRPHLRIHHS